MSLLSTKNRVTGETELVGRLAYPTSARHGLRWYELDFNWGRFRALQVLGLAHGVKRVRFNAGTSAWQLVRGRIKS